MDDVPQTTQPRRLAGQPFIRSAQSRRRRGLWPERVLGKLLCRACKVPGSIDSKPEARTAFQPFGMGHFGESGIDLDESFSSTGYSGTFLGLPRGPVPS
jgi:hypothetical protein